MPSFILKLKKKIVHGDWTSSNFASLIPCVNDFVIQIKKIKACVNWAIGNSIWMFLLDDHLKKQTNPYMG